MSYNPSASIREGWAKQRNKPPLSVSRAFLELKPPLCAVRLHLDYFPDFSVLYAI